MRQKGTETDARTRSPSLLDPRAVGFRHGMSASSVIGSSLGALYHPPRETPERLRDLLLQLDRGISSREM
jgi:hypothetical protein